MNWRSAGTRPEVERISTNFPNHPGGVTGLPEPLVPAARFENVIFASISRRAPASAEFSVSTAHPRSPGATDSPRGKGDRRCYRSNKGAVCFPLYYRRGDTPDGENGAPRGFVSIISRRYGSDSRKAARARGPAAPSPRDFRPLYSAPTLNDRLFSDRFARTSLVFSDFDTVQGGTDSSASPVYDLPRDSRVSAL